jgi:hypothetical protein
MTKLSRSSTASYLAAAGLAALSACGGSKGAGSDGSSGADGVPSSITYWLAPNGSEVVLKLDPVEPTTGF